MIPFAKPSIGQRERDLVLSALDTGWVSEGNFVAAFSDKFARLVSGGDVHPCSSGTAALHVALLSVGVGPGDEVILPATTYVATANAVLMCGATPVIVDVDESTWTISEREAERNVTEKTRAIIGVDLYGLPCQANLAHIAYKARRRYGTRCYVIEDRSQGIGAGGADTTCDIATYSFYSSKTITTGGEGGAVVVYDRDPAIKDRVNALIHQGAVTTGRYEHEMLGYNYRMTEMQAAFGIAQLDRLHEFLDKRRQIFELYYDGLAGLPVTPHTPRSMVDESGGWAFAVRLPATAREADVAAKLRDQGVETRPVFMPLWSVPHVSISSRAFWPGRVANGLRSCGLVLPTYADMDESDVGHVCDVLEGALE